MLWKKTILHFLATSAAYTGDRVWAAWLQAPPVQRGEGRIGNGHSLKRAAIWAPDDAFVERKNQAFCWRLLGPIGAEQRTPQNMPVKTFWQLKSGYIALFIPNVSASFLC